MLINKTAKEPPKKYSFVFNNPTGQQLLQSATGSSLHVFACMLLETVEFICNRSSPMSYAGLLKVTNGL